MKVKILETPVSIGYNTTPEAVKEGERYTEYLKENYFNKVVEVVDIAIDGTGSYYIADDRKYGKIFFPTVRTDKPLIRLLEE
jgi:hypothetical protein